MYIIRFESMKSSSNTKNHEKFLYVTADLNYYVQAGYNKLYLLIILLCAMLLTL